MHRLGWGLIGCWLIAAIGCDSEEAPVARAPDPAAAAPAPAPVDPAAAAAPAPAAPNPLAPAATAAPVDPAIAAPVAPPAPAGLPPGAPGLVPAQPIGPGVGDAPTQLVLPFPPFVVLPVSSSVGPIGNPAFAGLPGVPGQQPFGGRDPNSPAGPRVPQTDLESYGGVELFAVAPDGKLLATYAADTDKRPVVYEMKLWKLANGKSTGKLESADRIREMAISPDGKLLATIADEGGELTLWELPKGTKTSTHKWAKYGGISFSNDSQRIVTTAGRKGIAILDLATGKVTTKRMKNLAKTLAVRVSPIEPLLAVGLGVEKRPEHKSAGLAPLPANASKKEIADRRRQQQQKQGGQNTSGRRKGKKDSSNDPAQAQAAALGLEPDAEGVVQIIDLDTFKVRKKLYVTGAPSDLAFNSKGTMLAAWMVGGAGAIWDTAEWSEGGKLGRVGGGSFIPPPPADGEKDATPEGSLLALAPAADWAAVRQNPTSQSLVDVWDTKTGQQRPIDQNPVSQVGFLPGGALIDASHGKPLRFFELPAIKEIYPPFFAR